MSRIPTTLTLALVAVATGCARGPASPGAAPMQAHAPAAAPGLATRSLLGKPGTLAAPPPASLLWARHVGTAQTDDLRAAATLDNAVYVGGYTLGSFPGFTNAAPPNTTHDAVVHKMGTGGNATWTAQFGTPAHDQVNGLATSALGLFAGGETEGDLAGAFAGGSRDAFVRRFKANGAVAWTRQFGTASSDVVAGVAATDKAAYAAGNTDGAFPGQTNDGAKDAFVRKLDGAGNELWTRQFGPPGDGALALAIAADAAYVYVAGQTNGDLDGAGVGDDPPAGVPSAFVRKYLANGELLWTRQFAAGSRTVAWGVALGAGGVYAVGETNGAFPDVPGTPDAGGLDPFVAKLDPTTGTTAWAWQAGTATAQDTFNAVAADGAAVYATGFSNLVEPSGNVAVAKFAPDGSTPAPWAAPYATYGPPGAIAFAAALDARAAYVAGRAAASFTGEPTFGGEDGVVLKLAK